MSRESWENTPAEIERKRKEKNKPLNEQVRDYLQRVFFADNKQRSEPSLSIQSAQAAGIPDPVTGMEMAESRGEQPMRGMDVAEMRRKDEDKMYLVEAANRQLADDPRFYNPQPDNVKQMQLADMKRLDEDRIKDVEKMNAEQESSLTKPQIPSPTPVTKQANLTASEGQPEPTSSPEGTEEQVSPQNEVRGYLTRKYGIRDTLAEARRDRDFRTALAGIGEGADRIGTAIAGTEFDSKPYDQARQRAEQAVTDVKETQDAVSKEMEQIAKEMEMASAEQLADPNSAISQKMRLAYSKVLTDLGLPQDTLNGLTAKQIEEQLGKPLEIQQRIQAQQENAEANRELRRIQLAQMQQNEDEKNRQRVKDRDVRKENALNQIASTLRQQDKSFQKLEEQMGAFARADATLEQALQGNQVAINALGTQLARAFGEVGALTEQDVSRFQGNVSYARKLKDWASRGFQGDITPDNKQDLQALVNWIREVGQTNLDRKYNELAATMISRSSNILDENTGEPLITWEVAHQRLGNPRYLRPIIEKYEQPKQGNSVLQNIQAEKARRQGQQPASVPSTPVNSGLTGIQAEKERRKKEKENN